jgi:ketosteroid isomerase-like protein
MASTGPPGSAARHVQVVRDLYAAFARRDVAAILAVLSDDVEWSEPANPFNPAGGMRRGHTGFLEWVRVGNDAEEVQSLDLREFLTGADTVAAVGHTRCTVRSTGTTYETDFVHLITFKEGQIIRFQEFFDTYAAAEAFRGPTATTERE